MHQEVGEEWCARTVRAVFVGCRKYKGRKQDGSKRAWSVVFFASAAVRRWVSSSATSLWCVCMCMNTPKGGLSHFHYHPYALHCQCLDGKRGSMSTNFMLSHPLRFRAVTTACTYVLAICVCCTAAHIHPFYFKNTNYVSITLKNTCDRDHKHQLLGCALENYILLASFPCNVGCTEHKHNSLQRVKPPPLGCFCFIMHLTCHKDDKSTFQLLWAAGGIACARLWTTSGISPWPVIPFCVCRVMSCANKNKFFYAINPMEHVYVYTIYIYIDGRATCCITDSPIRSCCARFIRRPKCRIKLASLPEAMLDIYWRYCHKESLKAQRNLRGALGLFLWLPMVKLSMT